ncbi:hypothetical protein LCGC14_2643560, partial [marine sediment metagenome]
AYVDLYNPKYGLPNPSLLHFSYVFVKEQIFIPTWLIDFLPDRHT